MGQYEHEGLTMPTNRICIVTKAQLEAIARAKQEQKDKTNGTHTLSQ
jgi:hypothetical protein